MVTRRRCQFWKYRLKIDEDANKKISGILYKLLQQQGALELDIYFDGNPLNYHLFMALFCEAVEIKLKIPQLD